MKQFFKITASTSPSSAEQPASPMADEHGDGGSAVQPALQLGSIADVRRWLDTDCVSGQSAEVQRLREAVNILTRPKPRQEDVQRLLSRNNWNVPQKKSQKKRPLADVIGDLKCKVLEAARKLQTQSTEGRSSASGSAEQPALAGSSTDRADAHDDVPADKDPVLAELKERQRKRTKQTDLPSDASSAEQPGTSSGVLLWDINLVNQRRLNLQRSIFFPEVNAKKAPTPVHSEAFGLLQDCRKYRDKHFLMDEDDQTKLGKIIRELEIESQPQCSQKMCRELYKLTNVKKILGPFAYKAKAGCQEELDHNEVRYTAFLASTREDLMAFLSGRDALPAELYPHIADLVVDWEESKSVVDMGAPIRVIRKSWRQRYTEGLLEILKPMLVTEDLFLLPDYAENEWLYRLIAAERDQAAGITIEGPWDLEVWETEGLKGDIEKIRKDMEIQGLLGRAELLEKEIETCRRKDEARRKWLGMETLVQLKEVQRDGCSSIEEHEVQIKELMALKKECRTRWREQGKGDDECARLWSAYCLLVMQSCTAC